MFKARGRPDDPINIRIAENNKSLAGFITINNLSATAPVRKTPKKRQPFIKESKKPYASNCDKYDVAARPLYTQSSSAIIRMKYGKLVRPKVPLPKFTKTLMTLNVPGEPSTSKELEPKNERVTKDISDMSTKSVLNILQEMEKIVQLDDSDKDLLREVDEANEQVDVAAVQLKHINQVISKNTSKSCGDSSQPKKLTKFHVPAVRANMDKKKKLVGTLNTLNEHLQRMEQKMQKYKHKYKSINDFFPLGSSMESLFKNIDTPQEFKNTSTETTDETEMKEKPKPYETTEKAVETQVSFSEENLPKKVESPKINNTPVLTKDKSVSVIMEPKPVFHNPEPSKPNPLKSRQKVEPYDTRLEPTDVLVRPVVASNALVFDEDMEDTILTSNYLLKEFHNNRPVRPGMPFPLESDYTTVLLKKIAQARQKLKISDEKQLQKGRRYAAGMYMEQRLKNSLYTYN